MRRGRGVQTAGNVPGRGITPGRAGNISPVRAGFLRPQLDSVSSGSDDEFDDEQVRGNKIGYMIIFLIFFYRNYKNLSKPKSKKLFISVK